MALSYARKISIAAAGSCAPEAPGLRFQKPFVAVLVNNKIKTVPSKLWSDIWAQRPKPAHPVDNARLTCNGLAALITLKWQFLIPRSEQVKTIKMPLSKDS
jgi:hypothetical protein